MTKKESDPTDDGISTISDGTSVPLVEMQKLMSQIKLDKIRSNLNLTGAKKSPRAKSTYIWKVEEVTNSGRKQTFGNITVGSIICLLPAEQKKSKYYSN